MINILMSLFFSAEGEDGVPLSIVVKLTKLAYCYEQWDFFDNIIDNVIAAMKVDGSIIRSVHQSTLHFILEVFFFFIL